LSWRFAVGKLVIDDESRPVAPALMTKPQLFVRVYPTRVVRYLQMAHVDCQIAVRWPMDLDAMGRTVTSRFQIPSGRLAFTDSHGQPLVAAIPSGVGATVDDPIRLHTAGPVTQRLKLVRLPQEDDVCDWEFPLAATVSELTARLGVGEFRFTHNDCPIFQDPNGLLAQYPMHGGPVRVERVRKEIAPKLLLRSISGSSRAPPPPLLQCEVVFSDDPPITVQVSKNTTIADVLRHAEVANRLKGALPIVRPDPGAGDLLPLDCIVESLVEPRRVWITFADRSAPHDSDISIIFDFCGQMCSVPVSSRESVAALRTRLAPLLHPGDEPIVFRRSGTALADGDLLTSDVTATLAGSPGKMGHAMAHEKPPNWAERLELVVAISGLECGLCRRFLKFHNCDAQTALLDLLMPPNPK
jgi:hypothetical protein